MNSNTNPNYNRVVKEREKKHEIKKCYFLISTF